MNEHSLQQVVQCLRVLVPSPNPGTDSELLRAYAMSHDERAFAELLRRHGPLVMQIMPCQQANA